MGLVKESSGICGSIVSVGLKRPKNRKKFLIRINNTGNFVKPLPSRNFSEMIRMSKAMAKLGELSRATLYSTCLLGWLNMKVTSKQHVPRVICMSWRQEMSLLSPRNVCVSLAINFVRCYKVSEGAKLRDAEGTSMSHATCLLV